MEEGVTNVDLGLSCHGLFHFPDWCPPCSRRHSLCQEEAAKYQAKHGSAMARAKQVSNLRLGYLPTSVRVPATCSGLILEAVHPEQPEWPY